MDDKTINKDDENLADPVRQAAFDAAQQKAHEEAERRFEGTPASGKALSDTTPRGTVLRDVINPSNPHVVHEVTEPVVLDEPVPVAVVENDEAKSYAEGTPDAG